MLAKAMAGETGMAFLAAEGGQFLQKYVGEGPQAVHELFQTCLLYTSRLARNMLTTYGMDDQFGLASLSGKELDGPLGEKLYNQVNAMLTQELANTVEIIRKGMPTCLLYTSGDRRPPAGGGRFRSGRTQCCTGAEPPGC